MLEEIAPESVLKDKDGNWYRKDKTKNEAKQVGNTNKNSHDSLERMKTHFYFYFLFVVEMW